MTPLTDRRPRLPPQPLTKEGVDLRGRQPVTQGLQAPRVGTGKDPIVQGLEGDPALGQLPFDVLVAVEAELGGVGKVGAELQEERAKALVHAIEVKVVDHGRGAHEPGIGLLRARVPALLGPDHPGLFLGAPHEHNARGGGEARQVRRHHVVLRVAFLEGDQRDPLLMHVCVDGTYERLAHLVHQRRRGKGLPPMRRKKPATPLSYCSRGI